MKEYSNDLEIIWAFLVQFKLTVCLVIIRIKYQYNIRALKSK